MGRKKNPKGKGGSGDAQQAGSSQQQPPPIASAGGDVTAQFQRDSENQQRRQPQQQRQSQQQPSSSASAGGDVTAPFQIDSENQQRRQPQQQEQRRQHPRQQRQPYPQQQPQYPSQQQPQSPPRQQPQSPLRQQPQSPQQQFQPHPWHQVQSPQQQFPSHPQQQQPQPCPQQQQPQSHPQRQRRPQQQRQPHSQQPQQQQRQPHLQQQPQQQPQPRPQQPPQGRPYPQQSEGQTRREGAAQPAKGKGRGPQQKLLEPTTELASQITQVKLKESPIKAPDVKSSPLDFIVPQRQKLLSGGTKGRKILIETNHLALQLKKLGTAIHYDVAIDPDKPKKLLKVVMEQFRRQNYPNRYPAFDGFKNLYSSSFLPFGEETAGEVTIQEDDRDKTFKIKIKFAAHVDLSILSKYFESSGKGNTHMVTPQEAIQCIDVVLRNAPSLRCIPVGRSFFTKPRDRLLNLGEGMEMYYGFYQSAILGWKPFLNVDVSHKAFPKAISVLDLVAELCGDRYDIRTPLERFNYDTVNKFLCNLKVIYQIQNQQATRRIMRINGLDRPANQARFKNDKNEEMTVADYFTRVKKITLRFPHLPCLWVGSKQREPRILLPMEFCTICEGQVTQRAMTPGQTSSMIKIAATSTTDRKNKIMNGVRTAQYDSDPCVKEFQISVNPEFSKIPARILEPPQLRYLNKKVTPRSGVWRAEPFEVPTRLSNWCIFCVDDRTRPQNLQEFAINLVKEGKMLGMVIETPEILPSQRLPYGKEKMKLEEQFSKLKNKSLILVVIPDFVKEVYNYVKQAAELTVGVVTQCVKAKNVYQRKPSTLSNILLKINAKLNGRNHHLEETPLCFRRPCIVMGADVTHPSPDQRGTVPSVAAVTASHDQYAFQYNITWRLQPSTQEIITDLANIVKEHLLFFYRKNAAKPERIIFFRDGVSEGQFEIVVQSEVQAVRNACAMLDSSGNYKPKLTFLVVQKRHHTRFFPTNPRDSEDRNFNVPAGTVVDTEITHPTALDFYLVSHASIQGVARPTKYRKLWDDADMQEDELEELTYHLCHMFTRCNRSVSYPAPTYYAHLAAARAKVYCERRPINMNNLDKEQSLLQIRDELTKGFPMFFV